MPILGIIASQISGHLFQPSGSYDSIATVNGNGSATSLTFSSIPSTYKHLQLRWIARDGRPVQGDSLFLQFNADTGSNYVRYHLLYGDGATVSSLSSISTTSVFFGYAPGTSAAASIYGAGVTDILDYSNTNKNKTTRNLLGEDFNGSGDMAFSSGLWMNTSAISSITILTGTGTAFTTASQFALYGIKGD